MIDQTGIDGAEELVGVPPSWGYRARKLGRENASLRARLHALEADVERELDHIPEGSRLRLADALARARGEDATAAGRRLIYGRLCGRRWREYLDPSSWDLQVGAVRTVHGFSPPAISSTGTAGKGDTMTTVDPNTLDPNAGRREGDQVGRSPQGGRDQNEYTHTDSGNSGGSKQTEGGPGTAGSHPAATPGAPKPS